MLATTKKCFTALSRQAKSSGEPDQIVQLQIRTKVQPNVEQKTDEDDIYAPEGVTNQEHYRFLGFMRQRMLQIKA